ncbi:BQ5605_C002g01438 [Microbotryum silenes-dioicae]|uniref:BQ5605_C002g01438 protein n=1 Tax=Microbotryum silenes-dioicae TaxID=796604 RepID=A0A2X0P1M2_9BASI|nr:BQ5605_C002g01438 [Microbotryum silenes-dioicae]
MALSSTSASALMKPKGKALVGAIALGSLVFHLVLSSKLGWVSSHLASDREEEDWRRLEGIRAVVGVGRAVSLASGAVAALGLYGIVKDHLPFLRLFTLNSFISLGGELGLLLVIVFFASSSSSSSVTSSMCASVSNSDISLELFGWSQETCEERFSSLLLTFLGFAATVSLLRAWCSVQVLGYYTDLSKRLQRRPHLSINVRSATAPNAGGYYDREPDSAGGGYAGSLSSKRQRIFLLPQPIDRQRDGLGVNVPLLSFTSSTPDTTSFPPTSFPPTTGHTTLTPIEETPKYLVYAPVMMTAEEARTIGARELVLGSGNWRMRSRSNPNNNHSVSTPLSAHPVSGLDSPTPTPTAYIPSLLLPTTDEAPNVKGKVA